MKALIKLGGTLLDSPESRTRLAREISRAITSGLDAVVVHGGGKQMTRFLTERGVESRFVNGLRVTDANVLDAVLKVLAGTVNQELVAAFVAAGTPAIGLTGMDGLLTEAEILNKELGFVGRPVASNVQLLNLLTGNRYLPVIACVAGDKSGQFYNVNADQMASSLAAALRVDKLLFLTDVDGVKGAGNQVYESISAAECEDLIAKGIATGGMQAKLESAMAALRGGVGEVVIAPGARTGVIELLLKGSALGTRIIS